MRRSWSVSAGVLLLMSAAATVSQAGEREVARRLLAAVDDGDATRVAALLRRGADPNLRDGTGRPLLLLAAASRRLEIARTLLGAGASPDAADQSGWTPLHQAATDGDTAIAGALLDAGATPDLRSRARGTALDVAQRDGRTEIARLLRQRGARGSGKSIGDTVCVRPWRGDGYCGVVETVDRTRFRLRVREVVGCARGCTGNPSCAGGRAVGGANGLTAGEMLWVAGSCLTHTGVE